MSDRESRQAAQRTVDAVPFHSAVLRPIVRSVDIAAGQLVLEIEPSPSFRRSTELPHFHAGVIASLVDVAASVVVELHLDRATPTLDLRVDYLRPAAGPLVARADVQRAARTIATVDVVVENANGRVVALGRGTFIVADP